MLEKINPGTVREVACDVAKKGKESGEVAAKTIKELIRDVKPVEELPASAVRATFAPNLDPAIMRRFK